MPLDASRLKDGLLGNMYAAKLSNPVTGDSEKYFDAYSRAIIEDIKLSAVVTGACPPSGHLGGGAIVWTPSTLSILLVKYFYDVGLANPGTGLIEKYMLGKATSVTDIFTKPIHTTVNGICAGGACTGTLVFATPNTFKNVILDRMYTDGALAIDGSIEKIAEAMGSALQEEFETNATITGTYSMPAGGPLAGGKVM